MVYQGFCRFREQPSFDETTSTSIEEFDTLTIDVNIIYRSTSTTTSLSALISCFLVPPKQLSALRESLAQCNVRRDTTIRPKVLPLCPIHRGWCDWSFIISITRTSCSRRTGPGLLLARFRDVLKCTKICWN